MDSKIKNSIDVKALKCKNDLLKVAMADRSMSVDEERLVNATISNLENLRKYVRISLSDSRVSLKEKNKISEFVEKIASTAMEIAGKDGKYTFDEKLLLQVIKKNIIEMRQIVKNIKIGAN